MEKLLIFFGLTLVVAVIYYLKLKYFPSRKPQKHTCREYDFYEDGNDRLNKILGL